MTPRCPHCDGLGVTVDAHGMAEPHGWLSCVDCGRRWKVPGAAWNDAGALDAEWEHEKAQRAREERVLSCVYPKGEHRLEPVLSAGGQEIGKQCGGCGFVVGPVTA